MLLSTDLIPRNDDQKIAHIKTIFHETISSPKIKTLIPVYSDAMQMLKEMATRNSIPALELLLDTHCAEESKGVHAAELVSLFERMRHQMRASDAPTNIPHLVSDNFYDPLTYFCGITQTMEPLWPYAECLLEFILKNKDHKAVAPATSQIKKIAIAINGDVENKKTDSVFFVESKLRTQLIDRLSKIVSNKGLVTQLQFTESYGAVLKLYEVLNPDEAAGYAEAQLMAEAGADQLVAAFLDPSDSTTHHHLDNQNSHTKVGEFTDIAQWSKTKDSLFDLSEYVDSSYYKIRCRIEDLYKRKDFKLYKLYYEHDKPVASYKKDAQSIIQHLLLMAAHEYMIAQADSAKPLQIFEIDSAKSFIQEAIIVHPLYGFLEVANALADNFIWPRDVARGYAYLQKALENASKHEQKLTPQDRIYISSAQKHYATLITAAGFAHAIQLFSNKVSSPKKVAK